MNDISSWGRRHGVPQTALVELYNILQPSRPVLGASPGTEASTQAGLRVDASTAGNALWRNNNGAAMTDDGRHIRFGLGNDSQKLNKVWKSSDLIGMTRVTSTAVGQVFGVFTAIECKRPGWVAPENERDRAQASFISTVRSLGGIGGFATDRNQYKRIIEECLSKH